MNDISSSPSSASRLPSSTALRVLDACADGFDDALKHLLAWEEDDSRDVEGVVRDIIKDVKTRGDEALLEYTNRIDDGDVPFRLGDRFSLCNIDCCYGGQYHTDRQSNGRQMIFLRSDFHDISFH